jgi:hypothetical protein
MILWQARLVFAKVLEQAEADATAKTPGYDEPRATALDAPLFRRMRLSVFQIFVQRNFEIHQVIS